MPINMGMGRLGSNTIIHKRKFRWTFEVNRSEGKNVPANFVKVASRPNLNIEETEVNFLNAKRFLPGKGTWETVTVTYYDVSETGAESDANIGLWEWLASVYDYTGGGIDDPNPNVKQSSLRNCYSGTGRLLLYDGCGNPLEQWDMIDCWPQSVNFGELDYADSEAVTIDVTLRYSGVNYRSFCGGTVNVNCCGCDAGSSAGASLPNSMGASPSRNAVLGNAGAGAAGIA